jgi:uncharacterized protein
MSSIWEGRMHASRRAVIGGLSAAVLGFGGMRRLIEVPAAAQPVLEPYGPLATDPAGLLDLPRGFSYTIVSREGEPMSDGLITPGSFDGMACFPHAGGRDRVILVRNHEVWPDATSGGAFGADHRLATPEIRSRLFDAAPDGTPKLGGTTTLVWDMRARRLVRAHLSLGGTCGNCAGGATPWGSWLTCEETIEKTGARVSRDHGFVFEVPAAATGLVQAVPLTGMGRFVHEAAAVDPATGIVYLTEDRPDGLFYRFLPNRPGRLAEGGRLQALALPAGDTADLRNWPADGSRFAGAGQAIGLGRSVPVRWIDMDDVASPDGDLKDRGFAKGALRFARGEGLAVGHGRRGASEIFISCTMGGPKRLGQVWRYRPGAGPEGGTLELFVATTDPAILKNCDNVAVAPWGDLILCEDGADDQPQFLRGVTPTGALYTLARNAYSEFAGACFSPDGRTMFVNAQSPGITFAVTGPWRRTV